MYKAYIFDLNGTVIDDMNYHIKAWHEILIQLGAHITIEETKHQCYGKNQELLERIFPGRFNEDEKNSLSREKETVYQKSYQPYLKLLPGLDVFLKNAEKAGITMAIGSAAIMFNIDFVVDNLQIRHYFNAIVSADDVIKSKPDPETFLKCAHLLGVAPRECLVFEDAPKGIEAALHAGMNAVAITTMHGPEELKGYDNVIKVISNFEQLGLL